MGRVRVPVTGHAAPSQLRPRWTRRTCAWFRAHLPCARGGVWPPSPFSRVWTGRRPLRAPRQFGRERRGAPCWAPPCPHAPRGPRELPFWEECDTAGTRLGGLICSEDHGPGRGLLGGRPHPRVRESALSSAGGPRSLLLLQLPCPPVSLHLVCVPQAGVTVPPRGPRPDLQAVRTAHSVAADGLEVGVHPHCLGRSLSSQASLSLRARGPERWQVPRSSGSF